MPKKLLNEKLYCKGILSRYPGASVLETDLESVSDARS